MGILNGATARDFGAQDIDLCGSRVAGFWSVYQNHVWAFELGLAALIGGLVLLLLLAARRGNAAVVAVLAVLVLVPSAVPWLAQYDRGGDGSPKIFDCHGL